MTINVRFLGVHLIVSVRRALTEQQEVERLANAVFQATGRKAAWHPPTPPSSA